MKTKLSILIGLLVSAALLYFAFRNVDFRKLCVIYGGVNNIFIIPIAAVIMLELFLRGLRWKLLLDPGARHPFRGIKPQVDTALAVSPAVRVWDAFRLETAGLALNNILPLRLGEIMRGTSGAGFFQIPMMTVFATILVERALDTIVLFALFAAAAGLGGVTGGLGAYSGYFWTLLGGLAAVIAALIFIDEITAQRFFSGFFGKFPRVKKGLANLALGIKAFHSFKTGCAVIALAILQWLLDALNFYLVALAFGIEGVINLYKCVVVLFTTAMAASIPGVPGYFGNFEFAVARVLNTWGVADEVGFAFAAYIHMLTYLIVTVLGLIFVYQMGQSLGKVWAQFRGKTAVR
ncbi:MAG: flippase-like domain-containing protein [Elusimicrobia bacterium]|nr:flippase-like domain-containing protein [Elusimicrobiota bacterium]